MRLTPLLALLIAGSAAATPLSLTQQGRMFDQNGDPLNGSFNLTFALYNVPAGGAVLWQEAQSTGFDNGYYAVVLGDTTPMDDAMFASDDLYVGLSVGAGAELPDRQHVRSVPFAIRAGVADSVAGGSAVDVTEVMVNGTTVIDSSGNISWNNLIDVPAMSDTLIDLGCVDGQVARMSGGSWGCIATTRRHHQRHHLGLAPAGGNRKHRRGRGRPRAHRG